MSSKNLKFFLFALCCAAAFPAAAAHVLLKEDHGSRVFHSKEDELPAKVTHEITLESAQTVEFTELFANPQHHKAFLESKAPYIEAFIDILTQRKNTEVLLTFKTIADERKLHVAFLFHTTRIENELTPCIRITVTSTTPLKDSEKHFFYTLITTDSFLTVHGKTVAGIAGVVGGVIIASIINARRNAAILKKELKEITDPLVQHLEKIRNYVIHYSFGSKAKTKYEDFTLSFAFSQPKVQLPVCSNGTACWSTLDIKSQTAHETIEITILPLSSIFKIMGPKTLMAYVKEGITAEAYDQWKNYKRTSNIQCLKKAISDILYCASKDYKNALDLFLPALSLRDKPSLCSKSILWLLNDTQTTSSEFALIESIVWLVLHDQLVRSYLSVLINHSTRFTNVILTGIPQPSKKSSNVIHYATDSMQTVQQTTNLYEAVADFINYPA